ncbi:BamA/TamA family outer membrane protein [Balneola sp. MJW-20]|uniref:BamA/TamA family outer membrane protein n=1 Tax=Gracilimonas aurantiaca TaxID=3234185 RepID=UPI0034673C06
MHSNKYHYRQLTLLLIFLSLLLSFPTVLHAQTTGSESNTEDVVRRVRFAGNRNIKDRTLETLVRTRTNREFLGVPRFTPWYFIWKVSGGRFGEDPAYLDRAVVANDIERIRLYYESQGFLNVSVDTTVIEYRTDKIEVSFLIDEGDPSIINTVTYRGMPFFEDTGKRINFFRESPLTGGLLNDTTFTVDQQYKSQALTNEQNRIITFLKNNGFASIQRDSVIALVKKDQDDPLQLDVQYRIRPGKIYRFGDVDVKLADTESPDNYSQRDTLSGKPYTTDSSRVITMSKEPGAQSKFTLLSDQILFEPGAVYNHSLYLETVNEYQNLGMLFIRRFGQSEDDIQPDYTKEFIPSYFDLQTLTKHRITTEFFGMLRYGFGTGFGVDYTNNNVFGNAENLSISANASFEFVSSRVLEENQVTDGQSRVFRQYELRTDYTVPRLQFPFRFLDNRPFFTRALTRYTLSYSRSDQLLFDINSDIRFNLQYEVNHTPRYTSFLDLLELDLVDTSPSDAYIRNLRNEFNSDTLVIRNGSEVRFDTLSNGQLVDSFELRRILNDFDPQVSSILRYTFRSANTDIIKRNFGYFSEYSVALGGNIPFLLDRFVITPDTLEGNLPSLLGLSENSLTYGRFIKLTADYRRYIPVSNNAVFAWRIFGGFAQPYGGSDVIPLNRRFFAGGSNDIRGWAPFQLGPGNISPDNVTINGGEIKLAAFTETRQTVIENFIGADWIGAWFVDAGNVWYGPKNDFRDDQNQDILEEGRFKFDRFYKQIAVGSGLGLRLDWQYLVVRFDFAFRVHDLDDGWFNNKKLFFSFGVGHSF